MDALNRLIQSYNSDSSPSIDEFYRRLKEKNKSYFANNTSEQGMKSYRKKIPPTSVLQDEGLMDGLPSVPATEEPVVNIPMPKQQSVFDIPQSDIQEDISEYNTPQLGLTDYIQEAPLASVGNANKVRDLIGKIPYEATDGTNCMRTMGIALKGTPYEGQINVDQAVATAEKNGQLMNPKKYIPKAGDMAVVNDGNHIVMMTENGGTIQNGKSHNGVYESKQSPEEMFGNVKYYIRTSDYN